MTYYDIPLREEEQRLPHTAQIIVTDLDTNKQH